MSDIITMKISIPSDDDGFVPLRCPSCLEEFRLLVEDIEDESLIDTWCPGCGLIHVHYLTGEVEELGSKIVENLMANLLNDAMKDMEKQFRGNKFLKVKASKPIKEQAELPIGRPTEYYVVKKCENCKKKAKVTLTRNYVGGYCPHCGDMINGS